MAIVVSSPDIDSLYSRLVREVFEGFDHESSPRGMPIRERLCVTAELWNPRSRLVSIPARKASAAYAVGESCWYLRADDRVETILPYSKRMASFSDDGKTLRSAYGKRLFNSHQFADCIKTLVADPDTRRAVLIINTPGDLHVAANEGTKDLPCTMALQFFVRKGRLDMVTHMRSNDLIWGFTYDVFFFTLLQEIVCLILQKEGLTVELGRYTHIANSLHVYDRHFDMCREIIGATIGGVPAECGPPDPALHSLHEVSLLDRVEEAVRGGTEVPDVGDENAFVKRYLPYLETHFGKER